MEKRINCKVTDYIDNLKKNIKSYVETNENICFKEKSELLKFIYDFETLEINKQDFVKRKRSKSVVPFYNRCIAKKSCGEQCTRKKKTQSNYCGTHDKNRPHGELNDCEKEENILKKVEIWIQEINGISYYIDKNNNVYKTEDILCNSQSPSIIAKYGVENGVYKFVNTYNSN
jgi:hypothetical protein